MVVRQALYSDVKARNRPSFYATPVAWATADFTQMLIQDDGPIVPHSTGLIVASDACSLATIRELSRSATQGTMSPLRFAGASPSIVAGLPALQQGIRGPTLSLTMQPEHASDAIVAIVGYWMKHAKVESVIAVAHYQQGKSDHLFKGLIARSAGDDLKQLVQQLCDPHARARPTSCLAGSAAS